MENRDYLKKMSVEMEQKKKLIVVCVLFLPM